MKTPVTLFACAALAACGAAPVPAPGGPVGGRVVLASANDCAVIAAVARQHYRYDTRPALPLQRDVRQGEGPVFRVQCDWARYGLSFPRVFDPGAPRTPNKPVQWVRFERPRYDGNGATVETGYLVGPLAGAGAECRLRSGVAGWTVTECHETWIS